MNNFSFVYTIIQQLRSNPTQCLVTIYKEKQTIHQFNSYTMLNYLLLKTTTNVKNSVTLLSEMKTYRQYLKLLSLSD